MSDDPWWDKETDPHQRKPTAYHEAGHAVIAVEFGALILGVQIGGRPRCDVRFYFRDRSEIAGAEISHSLAGWLAETMYLPHLRRSDDDLRYTVEIVRESEPDDGTHEEGDDAFVFRSLLKSEPNATDEELIAEYRDYEASTLTILQEPLVWNKVEALAAELLKHEKLTSDEAMAVIKSVSSTNTIYLW